MIFIKNQFDIIYNDLDLKLRCDIKKPKNFITINVFFTILNNYKYK